MPSRAKKRLSPRERLLDEVAQARLQLEDFVQRGEVSVYPDDRHAALFNRYSDALRRLVGHLLAAPDWEAAPSDETVSWRWDASLRRFRFNYCGTVAFAAGVQAPRMRLSVRMSLDPEKSLEGELSRLAAEALFYREAADRMTCETLS